MVRKQFWPVVVIIVLHSLSLVMALVQIIVSGIDIWDDGDLEPIGGIVHAVLYAAYLIAWFSSYRRTGKWLVTTTTDLVAYAVFAVSSLVVALLCIKVALGPFILFTLAFLFEAIYVASRRVFASKLSMSLLDLASLDAELQRQNYGGRAGWLEGTGGQSALLDEELGVPTPPAPNHKQRKGAEDVEHVNSPLEAVHADAATVTPFRMPERREYYAKGQDMGGDRDVDGGREADSSTAVTNSRDVNNSKDVISSRGVDTSSGVGRMTSRDVDSRSCGGHPTEMSDVRSVSDACPTYDESMAMTMGVAQPKAAQVPLSPLSPTTPGVGGHALKRQIVDREPPRQSGRASSSGQRLSVDTRLQQAEHYNAVPMTTSTPTASTGDVVGGHDLKRQIVDYEHRRHASGGSSSPSTGTRSEHSPTVDAGKLKHLSIDKPQPPLPTDVASEKQ